MSEGLDILLPYQKRLVEDPARFTWNNWSRQTGKSFAVTVRRIVRGIRRKRNQVFLSASGDLSKELMLKARDHVDAMKIALSYEEIDMENPLDGSKFKSLEIGLPGPGIRLIARPANPWTARGWTGDLVLDEFAMHQNPKKIWAAAFPILTRGRGELDVMSTPNGRGNKFYELRDNDAYSHHTVTIHDACAQGLTRFGVDPEELRRGLGDEEIWRQEYLCEFLDGATAFLTFEVIAECEDDTLPVELDYASLLRHKGDVVVGVDIGRVKDLTVIWAFDVKGREMTSLGMMTIRDMPFSDQYDVIQQIVHAPCVRRAAVDRTGLGMQLGEDLVKHFGEGRVEACHFTPLFKASAASGMRNKFHDRTIRIPVSTEIRNDLHSVTRTVTTAGNVQLVAPREGGSHADRFWACALAVHAASTDLGPMEFMPGTPGPCGSEKLRMRGGDDW